MEFINTQSRYAINFDLVVKECKKIFDGSRSKAYIVLKKDMTELGFVHDQGSGYVSRESLTRAEFLSNLTALVKRNPWLDQCCKRLRVTRVAEDIFNGEAHGDLLRSLNEVAINVIDDEPKKRQKSPLEKRFEENRDKFLSELDLSEIPPEKRDEMRAKITEEIMKSTPSRREFDERARGIKELNPSKSAAKTLEKSQKSPSKNSGNDGAGR